MVALLVPNSTQSMSVSMTLWRTMVIWILAGNKQDVSSLHILGKRLSLLLSTFAGKAPCLVVLGCSLESAGFTKRVSNLPASHQLQSGANRPNHESTRIIERQWLQTPLAVITGFSSVSFTS